MNYIKLSIALLLSFNVQGMALKATSNQGVDLIKKFEGFRGDFYYDQVGAKTIGYGHACHGDGENCASIKAPMNEIEASSLLRKDLRSREECVARAVNGLLSENAYSALVSYAFNVGCEAFKASPVLYAVNRGDLGSAAAALKSQVRIGGNILHDLVVRREAEATLLCSDGGC